MLPLTYSRLRRVDMTLQGNTRPTETRKPKLFYGFVIVIAAFFIRFAWSGSYQSYGVFFKPLSTEFGWTRAATSGALSMFMLLAGASTILAGRLVDRFGPRLLMTVCGLFLV